LINIVANFKIYKIILKGKNLIKNTNYDAKYIYQKRSYLNEIIEPLLINKFETTGNVVLIYLLL